MSVRRLITLSCPVLFDASVTARQRGLFALGQLVAARVGGWEAGGEAGPTALQQGT